MFSSAVFSDTSVFSLRSRNPHTSRATCSKVSLSGFDRVTSVSSKVCFMPASKRDSFVPGKGANTIGCASPFALRSVTPKCRVWAVGIANGNCRGCASTPSVPLLVCTRHPGMEQMSSGMRKLSSGRRLPFHTIGWNSSTTSALGAAGAPEKATYDMPSLLVVNV